VQKLAVLLIPIKRRIYIYISVDAVEFFKRREYSAYALRSGKTVELAMENWWLTHALQGPKSQKRLQYFGSITSFKHFEIPSQ
jgi:hypothetical protein